MAQDSAGAGRPKFWIVVVGIVILLIFLYFYKPFEAFVAERIPLIRASNIIFWFTALVGVVGYAIAHWQSFRQNMFRDVSEISVQTLVFDTLQIAILIAVIFCGGATLQIIESLGDHLISRGDIISAAFGRKLLAMILLIILVIAFYLLHQVVRAFRAGRRPGRLPPRARSGSATSS